ncbi:MAG TPA: ATP-binding cassette domain-containing protein, partial [Anaeromyxobacter sp.]|nr:ATP-binding cassette domain-containing protein [Anaeromyxobacter sp.]
MAAPLVTLDRVDVRLAGALVLSEVSLELHAGEGLAILGGNGAGKSTLLRLLRGDLWPDPRSPGRRLFHGPDGAFESPIGVRERIARVAPEAQDAYVRADWDVPVEAAIRSGFFDALWPAEAATPAQAARVREVAATLGIGHLLGRSMLELSRGEGRRVLLARALAPSPAALLLDEACDGLDAAAREGFLALVSEVARRGTAVVTATHRPDEIVPEIERVLWLEGGRIARRGTRAEALGPRPAPEGPARARPRRDGPPVFQVRDATVLVEGRPVLDRVSLTV